MFIFSQKHWEFQASDLNPQDAVNPKIIKKLVA